MTLGLGSLSAVAGAVTVAGVRAEVVAKVVGGVAVRRRGQVKVGAKDASEGGADAYEVGLEVGKWGKSVLECVMAALVFCIASELHARLLVLVAPAHTTRDDGPAVGVEMRPIGQVEQIRPLLFATPIARSAHTSRRPGILTLPAKRTFAVLEMARKAPLWTPPHVRQDLARVRLCTANRTPLGRR
jgi:hypothetical protein